MVQKLQARVLSPVVEPEPKTFLKFGSFNINGMDLEVNWAVNQLISDRSFDVSDLDHKIFVNLSVSLNLNWAKIRLLKSRILPPTHLV